MNYMLTLLLASLAIFTANSQSSALKSSKDTIFIVVKVNGAVLTMPDSIRLGIEDEWNTHAPISFSSKEDYLIVVDKKKQEPYKIVPQEDLKSHRIFPSKVLTNTRPGIINNYAQLRSWLYQRRFLALGPYTEIAIGNGEFEVDTDHFFILRYEFHQQDRTEEINKKLYFKNHKLFFSKSEIFKVDGNSIAMENTSNFHLYFYDRVTEEALKIGPIHLFWIDEAQLKAELAIILSTFTGKKKDLYQQIRTYIHLTYGEPETQNLNHWLKTHLGITP